MSNIMTMMSSCNCNYWEMIQSLIQFHSFTYIIAFYIEGVFNTVTHDQLKYTEKFIPKLILCVFEPRRLKLDGQHEVISL